MNVVHLNTYASGGAFTAAFRIHRGLLNRKVNSEFLTIDKHLDRDGVTSYVKSRSSSKRAWNSVIYRWHRWQLSRQHVKSNHLSNLPYSAYDVSDHELLQNADIIHMHWVSEMIDFRSFFECIDAKIVWTHHDDWINNNLFHYVESDEDTAFGKYFKIKGEALLRNNVFSVTPSKWLEKRIKKFHPNCATKTIANGIRVPEEKKQFNPSTRLKVLLIAENLDDERKGVWPFLEIAIDNLHTVDLELVGESARVLNAPNIRFHGYVSDKMKLSELILASDLLVIPSTVDNLPNVLLEAMGFGIPAIGFDIGGISEVIIDGTTGYLADSKDYLRLAEIISMLHSNRALLPKLGENSRGHISSNFDINSQVSKYLQLYSELLE